VSALLGESCKGERAKQQSAEVIVAKKAGENRKEQRTEEPRNRPTKQTLANGASSHPKRTRSDTERFQDRSRGKKEEWNSTGNQKRGGKPRTRRKEVQEGAE
jgi:hypothetical protein